MPVATQQPHTATDGRSLPGGIWAVTEPAAAQSSLGLWQTLAERTDPLRYRPEAIPDIAEEQVTEDGETFTVMRSRQGHYQRLSEVERELWHRMDGSRTVDQLRYEALIDFGQLMLVTDFVEALREEGFLRDQPVGIYRALTQSIQQRTAEGWGRRVLRFLTGATLQFRNIDPFYSAINRALGWLIFSPAFLVLWVLIAGAGMGAFLSLLLDPGRRELLSTRDSLTLEIVWLWLVLLLSFFLHESAHALTVKHYGRQLASGGMMLYFGVPAFFVDTSDIWRSPLRARMITSAAGPMSDLFVGALAALGVYLFPEAALSGIALKLAFTCYIATLINLNPLLALDGYYILMDWLRMPNLRNRSLEFVRGPFWQKFQLNRVPRLTLSVQPFSREERWFTIYGLLALLYSVVAILFALQFWKRQLFGTILRLWQSHHLGGQIVAVVLVVVVLIPLVIGLAFAALETGRAALGWVLRHGYGRRPALLAGLAMLLTLGLATLASQIGETGALLLTLLLWSTAIGGILTLRPDYHRAAIAPALNAMLVTTFLAALGALAQLLLPRSVIWIAADGLAFVFIISASFAVLLDVNLRKAPSFELSITALLLMLAFGVGGLALITIGNSWPGWTPGIRLIVSSPAYFGAVASALLLPFLLALRDSRLFWSWGLLWLAIITETIGYLLDIHLLATGQSILLWIDVLAAGLWASAWLVHLATLRQITPAELHWPEQASLTEAERLMRAFRWSYAGCYQLLRAVYGSRRTQELDDRMDVFAATADWDVILDRDQARVGREAAALPLDSLGKRFAEVLRYTVATIEDLAGSSFARRAIRAAYDALPWPERETADRLCFPDTPWAKELSQSLGDVRELRLRLLRQNETFLGCDDATLELLSHTLQEQQVPAGHVLLRAGEAVTGIWLVEAGEVIAYSTTQDEVELHRGETFGAEDLLNGKTAGLSYRTSVPSDLLFITESDLRAALAAASTNTNSDAIAALKLFERMPLFANLPRTTLHQLASHAIRYRFAPRSVVIREGQPSGRFFIIEEGQALVIARNSQGNLYVVAKLGAEEFFGELELLQNDRPVASVVAANELTALGMPHAAIRQLMGEERTLARRLEQIGSGRLLELHRQR